MKNRMPQKKERRNSVELAAIKRFEKSRSRRYGVPAKLWLCGERTRDGVTEPCRLRRGEEYAIRENESAFQYTETVFCGGLGRKLNKHETVGFCESGNLRFSQSGSRFALPLSCLWCSLSWNFGHFPV